MPAITRIWPSVALASWQLGPTFARSHLISQADATEESDRRITVNKLVNADRNPIETVSTLRPFMQRQKRKINVDDESYENRRKLAWNLKPLLLVLPLNGVELVLDIVELANPFRRYADDGGHVYLYRHFLRSCGSKHQ